LALTASLLTPVPATASVVFDPSLKNLIVPPAHPVVVGVKLTVRSILCPAAKTSGRFKDDAVNSEFPEETPEMVTLACPAFVRVIGKVSVWATTVAPKRRFAGVHASCGVSARALTGVMQRSKIAKLRVRKLIARMRENWMMDRGSCMPPVWKMGVRNNRFRQYTQPLADRPVPERQCAVRLDNRKARLKPAE